MKKELKVFECRVSALQVNRVWPGTQRPLNQTETAYYTMFDFESKGKIKVEIEKDFNDYEIRPLSENIKSIRENNTIFIELDKPMNFVLEIDGKHFSLSIFANPISDKPIIKNNDLYFASGYHDAGLIWLHSGQTVYFEEGAVVSGVIYGKDVSNVKICGRGVLISSKYKRGNDLSGGGQEIRNALAQKGLDENNLIYIGNMVLNNCKDIYVEGIVLEDAPLWSIIIRDNCERINIDNIKIIGQWRYNSDGIDICCSTDITVKNSFIRSFDDCVVARGAYLPGEEGNCSNIMVQNLVCWCDWGIALEVWCGQKITTVSNVIFSDIKVIHTSAKVMDIATWYGSSDTLVENICFKKINVDYEESYENPTIEDDKHLGYIEDKNFIPYIICMYAGLIGKMDGVGTQKHIPADNYDNFNLRYRNIVFKDILFDKRLLSFKDERESLLKIDNVIIENSDIEF